MGKQPNTVRLRYRYNTVRISAPVNTDRYGPKTDRIYTVYRRKYPVFTAFSVRKRSVNDTILIDLGAAATTAAAVAVPIPSAPAAPAAAVVRTAPPSSS